jgi:hypothetical protein
MKNLTLLLFLAFTTICGHAQSNKDSLDTAYGNNAVKECQNLTLEGLKLIRKERILRLEFREARRLKFEIENYEKIIKSN